jgi:hypothetical protein
VVGAEQARQLGVGGAAPVEVGAERQHDDAAGPREADERPDELGALRLVLARGEDLFELVDHEHPVPIAAEPARGPRERAGGVLAGPDQRLRPVVAAGQDAARQRGQQPGPDGRRLAAAGRPDDREERRAHEPRDQLGHEPLAP